MMLRVEDTDTFGQPWSMCFEEEALDWAPILGPRNHGQGGSYSNRGHCGMKFQYPVILLRVYLVLSIMYGSAASLTQCTSPTVTSESLCLTLSLGCPANAELRILKTSQRWHFHFGSPTMMPAPRGRSVGDCRVTGRASRRNCARVLAPMQRRPMATNMTVCFWPTCSLT